MKNINETGSPDSESENSIEQEKIKEILKRSDQFVLISGPSGSGKTMVIKHLVDSYGFIEPPFLTTRELRPGEQEIGGVHLDQEEFAKREADQRVFLPEHNYGNSYGYDLDIMFHIAMYGKNVVVETNASNLSNYVVNFLPQSTVIGILPLLAEELEARLVERGLNDYEDIKKRLANFSEEKDYIIQASKLISVNQIVPIHGDPQVTISQIDKIMDTKGFKINSFNNL